MIHQVAKKFQVFREHLVVDAFIETETVRSVVLKQGLNISDQFVDLFEIRFLLTPQDIGIPRNSGELLATDHGSIDHGEIQLVLHQVLAGKPLDVCVMQRLAKTMLKSGLGLDRTAPTHIVRPKGHVFKIWCSKALKETIECLVTMLEFPVLSPHEWKSAEQPRNRVVTFP